MQYVELIAKSNFSFLTGASHPEELIQAAHGAGLSGMALTDLNGVYGLGRAYKIAKKLVDFKLIIGAELSFYHHPHIVILAKNRKAYGGLCRLISFSHGGKSKGMANLDFTQFLEKVAELQLQDVVVLPLLTDHATVRLADQLTPFLGQLQDQFGENLYLPLCRYLDGKDQLRSTQTLALAKKFALPIVAHNDVHYHEKSRKALQDVLISIRENKPLSQVGYQLFANAERYPKSPQVMSRLFSDLPEAIHNTQRIAEACVFSPKELRYQYPSEWIPPGFNAQAYLEHLVQENSGRVYKGHRPEAVEKLIRHELKIIQQLGYADYFLTIYDIVKFARSQNILCQGRGSAANSVVCYILGITAIDPVQMNLLFERFISAERNEPPDIDVDFEHERREEVIQYIYRRYGRDKAAMVSAVVTYQRRSAFREVSKAFGVAVGTLSAKKVEQNFTELSKDLPDQPLLRSQIEALSQELTGFPRHLSIHSGGFTLSADPIIEITPVEPARMDGRTIIQWDKYDLDELGLLKIDILALGMLSCIRKTLDLVKMQLHEIPHDDVKTYQMIRQADTVGTFQIESRAQISMLGRLQPRNFYDLVIEVAIMRPGPIVGKMVHPFLKRRRGLEKIHFPNKIVENILGKTLGVPLFQEQIMKLAIELAGFTPGEADKLRRTINAWKSSAPIGEMANRLMQGLIQGGMPESFAKQIFEQIQGFSHYGFPESHAASFALIAYASCYLKCHYPAEFTASLINSQPMGFYRNDTLVFDALRHGVKVLPVCVHHSEWDCTIENTNTIRLGFRVVKGLAKKDVELLLEERNQVRFSNLTDFLTRSSLRKDVLHRLALAGRLSSQNLNARQTLWAILEYENLFSGQQSQQLSFFNDCYSLTAAQEQSFRPHDTSAKIEADYHSIALSLHGHPMQQIRNTLQGLSQSSSLQLRKLKHGQRVKIAGMVLVRQKPPTAKGVTFCTLEDEHGFIDLILHAKTYTQYREILMMNSFLEVAGQLQKDGLTISVLVKSVKSLNDNSFVKREATNYFHW